MVAPKQPDDLCHPSTVVAALTHHYAVMHRLNADAVADSHATRARDLRYHGRVAYCHSQCDAAPFILGERALPEHSKVRHRGREMPQTDSGASGRHEVSSSSPARKLHVPAQRPG